MGYFFFFKERTRNTFVRDEPVKNYVFTHCVRATRRRTVRTRVQRSIVRARREKIAVCPGGVDVLRWRQRRWRSGGQSGGDDNDRDAEVTAAKRFWRAHVTAAAMRGGGVVDNPKCTRRRDDMSAAPRETWVRAEVVTAGRNAVELRLVRWAYPVARLPKRCFVFHIFYVRRLLLLLFRIIFAIISTHLRAPSFGFLLEELSYSIKFIVRNTNKLIIYWSLK